MMMLLTVATFVGAEDDVENDRSVCFSLLILWNQVEVSLRIAVVIRMSSLT